MKILMTSSGGVIKNLNTPEYGLARELVKKGHDVTVISSSSVIKKHEAMLEETIEGIKVKRFNPVVPTSLLYMTKNDFDLIHMHHLGYLAPISSYAVIIKKLRNIPSVFTIHGLYHDPYIVKDVNDPFSNKINKNIQTTFPFLTPWRIFDWFVHLPLKAEKITALTKWEKKETEKLGVNSNKIEVVPNGVNLEKYKKKGKKNFFKRIGIEGKTLLFVGQPTKRKGWNYFLQAMPKILETEPDAKAVFIGYRKSKEMEEACENLGITRSVKFLGFLPEERKIESFQSADVFVFPTLYEGFGIVFLEAMASGLPIITTDVAGNKEIIEDRKNGLIVKPKNSEEIALAALNLLNNNKLISKIKKNNLDKVKNYDWKKVAKRFLQVYESVIK